MSNDVTFDIVARDKASQTFSKVGKGAKGAESSISGLGSSAKKALGAVLAFETAKTVTKGLIGMAKAAAEDQTSVALLAKQFRNSAHATKEQIDATEAWITKVGIARGVADDELRPALANLVTATHDVRKAQQLTNLAMDVAAAKGKPLGAVSMALAKAYNGNVGALGRLGIKTKDATGKTLTFAEAQKEMNRQFGGAGAAKAKTFTGILDRFHVAVNEGGEAIGYKLLPELTKVVPKITKFVNGMQTGTGAGGKFVDEVKSEVIPVVKSLASEAKVLATATKPIIGILTQLPPGLVATGGASAVLGTKLGALRPQLEEGSSGFSKLGRAASSAAGGVGLLAVADAAKRTSPALGGLEGALGGAAAGFAATGNPIGALIGGAGGGLLGIFSSGKKAASGIELSRQAAKNAAGTLDNLSDSITDVTKGYDRLAKKQISDAVVKALGGGQKAAKTASDLGVTIQDLTGAAIGLPGPMKRVQDATARASGAVLSASQNIQSLNDKYLGLTKKQRNAASAAGEVTRALGALTGKTKEERAEAILSQIATTKLGKSLKGIPTNTIVKIGTEGAKKAQSDIIDLATRGKGLSDSQVKILVAMSGEQNVRAALKRIKDAADAAARARTLTITSRKLVLGSIGGSVGGGARGGSGGNTGPSHGKSRAAGRFVGPGISANSFSKPSGVEQWYHSFVASVAKGTPKVATALDRAKAGVDKLKDSLSSLRDTKAGYLATFSSDSIFGADSDATGGTLSGLLDFQSKQAQNAQQLLADVKAVTSKGLSKGLISQLQAAGSSGASQLHLLAGAGAETIKQFNDLDKATTSADAAAGLLAGNYYNGGKAGVGNINGQISTAQQQLTMAQALERQISNMSLKGEVKIRGGDIIVAVRAENNKRGRSPGDFSR